MNKSEEKAFNRLIQKLSALRQTLKGDERAMLDQLVLVNSSEVALHGITPPLGQSAMAKKAVSEIAIHQMDDAAARATAKKAVSNVAIRRTNASAIAKKAASEIAIHQMDDATAKAVSKKAVSNVAIRRTNASAVAKKAASEIAIHAMNVSKANAEQPVSYAVSMRVTLDEGSGEYRINKT